LSIDSWMLIDICRRRRAAAASVYTAVRGARFGCGLVSTRGVVVKKKWRTPETRLRQRFF